MARRYGFILCGTESTKIISTRYKSYGLIDLYRFLHIKCILPARFLNLLFHQSTTYITIFHSQTHNPQPTTQNNQNGPLLPYPPAALPSFSVSRAAAPTTHGASAPMGPCKARAIELGGTAVGSPVWGANASPTKILRGRRGLDLMWPPIHQDTQQSTQSQRKR